MSRAAIPPAGRPGRIPPRILALMVAVLGIGAVARVLALAALPGFFGPGDPATYYSMARGVLATGLPRVEFIWNFASLPATIAHVESYYEISFAYLLAAMLAVFGDHVFVARAFSTLCGIAAPVLTLVFALRLGPRIALIAATLVALEPWSIYYSGVLMKEAWISVVVLIALEAMRRLAVGRRGAIATGCATAAVALAAGAAQYELIPILGVTGVIGLLSSRRDALPAYLATFATGLALAVAAMWMALGVPLSGKFAFFTGGAMWTPEVGVRAPRVSSTGPARFLPLGYVLGSMLIRWYPAILVLAWIGSRSRRLAPPETAIPLGFTAAFFYFHGVPHDLWSRDFVLLLPVLAPLVAMGACHGRAWNVPIGRWLAPGPAAPGIPGGAPGLPWLRRGTVALALFAGTFAGVNLSYRLHVAGILPVRWMPWSVIVTSAVATGVCIIAARPFAFVFATRPFRAALPLIALGLVLAAYSQMLPWATIARNPEFPGFERRCAEYRSASELMRHSFPRGPVMTSAPPEVAFYSGFPAVRTPITQNPDAIRQIQQRYEVRYLLARHDELRPEVVARLGLSPLARFQNHVVYAFAEPAAGPVIGAREEVTR